MFKRSCSTVPSVKASRIREVFLRDMPKYQARLCSQMISDSLSEFWNWHNALIDEQLRLEAQVPKAVRKRWAEEAGKRFDRRDPENVPLRLLVDFCLHYCRQLVNETNSLRQQHAEFRRQFSIAETETEKRTVLLNAAAILGRSWWQLQGDRRATKRWLSEDALHDRFVRRIGKTELQLAFALERLGTFVCQVLFVAKQNKTDLLGVWNALNMDGLFQRVCALEADPRVHAALVRSFNRAVGPVEIIDCRSFLREANLLWLGKAATSETLDVWVQVESLTLLRKTAPSSFETVIDWRLKQISGGDDMFLRRRAVQLAFEAMDESSLASLIPHMKNDPSVFVRQKYAEMLWTLPAEMGGPAIRDLFRTDASHQVRAACLVAIPANVDRIRIRETVQDILSRTLAADEHEFVLRTAIHVCVTWVQLHVELARSGDASANDYVDCLIQQCKPHLRQLAEFSDSTPMRRWATAALERVRLARDGRLSELHDRLHAMVHSIPLGKSRTYSRLRLRGYSDEEIGRTLALLAQDDFGFDVSRGWFFDRITRGPVFGLRLWRVWFEFRNAATDKRQAFRHTIGRIGQGRLRVPSRIMAELSPTKVPGEPLFVSSEETWRPYVPLVDDFVSVLNQSFFTRAPFRFYTNEGVTTVLCPRKLRERIRATVSLTFAFAKLARLRNWNENSSHNPGDYLSAIRKLGFSVEFQPYGFGESRPDAPVLQDFSVLRFFGAIGFFLTPKQQEEFKSLLYDYAFYFNSSFENSLEHLFLFAIVFLAVVLVKHLYSNATLALARRRIPISIGGWGTRGKSGTERLKAALLGGMGYGLVSKTTGCEAMFIHADPHGQPLEIPLFRPYDKATIWEQRNLLIMSAKMRPSVFLWECMGLTPSYVDVLQRQWTRDDLGTITNTYPDHEDLQGPAGYDVATTISGFAPRRSHIITTEQQMRPLVRESCHRVKSSCEGVGWLESGLVAEDIQSRFPYAEHPDNIALVAAMAQHLGCDYDYAMKAMADYLVADLGVLKTYPVSRISHRDLEFTNGMSANERFGCLGNWKRTGYATQDPHAERGVWISTVVNNRADRVARSRVFANILVDDISADRHFLIGNNLKGLIGFIGDAWETRASKMTLCHEDEYDAAVALRELERAAKEFRQPFTADHVATFMRIMVSAVVESEPTVERIVDECANSPERLCAALGAENVDSGTTNAIVARYQEQLAGLAEVEELKHLIESEAKLEALDKAYRASAKKWFDRKIVVIENYTATGEQVIRRIVDETPPGIKNRVMGVQNIKGTGLDFVYRFQAWAACYEACDLVRSRDIQDVHKGLQALSLMPQIGQLCDAYVAATLQQLESSVFASDPEVTSLSQNVSNRLEESRQELAESLSAGDEQSSGSGRFDWLLDTLEQYFEINDAVRRRNAADQVYADLATERISRHQAVEQIRKINKRQKGGWLGDSVKDFFARFSRS
ncbi:MAG: hypothetical protein KDB27_00220 [Planctomycetales bacterium]|nr:hypothetical protein [Planctomycetales bacterium]